MLGLTELPGIIIYLSFSFAALWSIGQWLTSDFLEKKRKKARNQARKRKYLLWMYGVIVGISILAISCSFLSHSVLKERELQKLAGTLLAADDPDPPNGCLVNGKQVVLYFGDHSVIVETFPVIVLKVANKPVITLDQLEDGSMALSMQIRSEDERIIVEVNKNEFHINANNHLYFKRPDFNTLEVIDQYGRKAIEARYLNRHAIQINGRINSQGREIDLSYPIGGRIKCVEITGQRGSVILVE